VLTSASGGSCRATVRRLRVTVWTQEPAEMTVGSVSPSYEARSNFAPMTQRWTSLPSIESLRTFGLPLAATKLTCGSRRADRSRIAPQKSHSYRPSRNRTDRIVLAVVASIKTCQSMIW